MKRNRDYSDVSGKNSHFYKHGLTKDPVFYVWYAMVQRCHNPNHPSYCRYGAIGRTVCEEWRDNPKAFVEWSHTNGYKAGLSLDRIDNSKGYNPDNCRWVDRFIQANNTRRNHFVTANGETHTISEWARIRGISKNTILKRLRSGWSEEDALLTPIDKRFSNT